MADSTHNADSPQAQVALHNQMILAQIENQLRMGFSATLKEPEYYVVPHELTGVLSVLSSSTIDTSRQDIHGPWSFKTCIEFVNSKVVTRLAEKDSLTDHGEIVASAERQAEKESAHEST